MRRNFLLTFIPLIALAVVGILIESKAQDLSDIRAWIGSGVVIVAMVGLIVVFRHDLFPTKNEQFVEWQRLKAKGKLRYVARHALGSALAWLPFILGEFIMRRNGWVLVSVSWWLVSLVVALSIVWSLIWWRHLDGKYANL